jgi:hypothetical protein
MTPVSAAGLRVADPGRDLHGNLKFNLPVDLKLASPAPAALYVGLGHRAPSPSESLADSDSDRRSTVPMTDGTVDARTGKNFNFSERRALNFTVADSDIVPKIRSSLPHYSLAD